MKNAEIIVPTKEEVGKGVLDSEGVENGDTKTESTNDNNKRVQTGELKAEDAENGADKNHPTEGGVKEVTSKKRETMEDDRKTDSTLGVENGDIKAEVVENYGPKEGDTETNPSKAVEEVENNNTKPDHSVENAQSKTDNEKFETAVQELLKWFKENPNLPAEIELLLLKRFLKSVSCNIEDAKKLITLHYSIRTKNPHLFIDRDPEEEGVKKTNASRDLVALPGLTPDGHKVFFFRLTDYDPKLVDSISEIKHFYMLSDSRFTVSDSETHNGEDHIVAEGDVQVTDMSGYSWAHATRASFMTMRVHMKYMQEAYPMRLHASHMINCPAFMDRMLSWFRPFIKDEILKMMHFHRDLESLYEHVPRDMLPDEYGGKAGTVADLKERSSRLLNEKREYLMDPKYWIVEQPTRSRWSWF